MSRKISEPHAEETGRTRIRLGELATEVAQKVAGNEKITQAHLEQAIQELQSFQLEKAIKPTEETGFAYQQFNNLNAQMQEMNEQMVSLRYMILSLSAESEDQIQVAMRRLNTRLNEKQIEVAQETNLDIPTMTGLMNQFNMIEQRAGHQEMATETAKEQGREM